MPLYCLSPPPFLQASRDAQKRFDRNSLFHREPEDKYFGSRQREIRSIDLPSPFILAKLCLEL